MLSCQLGCCDSNYTGHCNKQTRLIFPKRYYLQTTFALEMLMRTPAASSALQRMGMENWRPCNEPMQNYMASSQDDQALPGKDLVFREDREYSCSASVNTKQMKAVWLVVQLY